MNNLPAWYVAGGALRQLFDENRKDYNAFLQTHNLSSTYARRLRSLHVFLSDGRKRLALLGISKCILLMQHERLLTKSAVVAKASSKASAGDVGPSRAQLLQAARLAAVAA